MPPLSLPFIPPDASAVKQALELSCEIPNLIRQQRRIGKRKPREDAASSVKSLPLSSNNRGGRNRKRWWRRTRRWPCDPKESSASAVIPWAFSSAEKNTAEDNTTIRVNDESSSTASSIKHFGWHRGGADLAGDDHASSLSDMQSLLPSMDASSSPLDPNKSTVGLCTNNNNNKDPVVESLSAYDCGSSTMDATKEEFNGVMTEKGGVIDKKISCQKTRRRDRRHLKQDVEILGMVVQFDPTFQLLEEKGQPEYVKRTALRQLQKCNVYKDSLLSLRDKLLEDDTNKNNKEEADESSSDGSSEEEALLLGFHLDPLSSLRPSSNDAEKEAANESLQDSGEEEALLLSFHLDPLAALSPLPSNDTEEEEADEASSAGSNDKEALLLGVHLDPFTSLPPPPGRSNNKEEADESLVSSSEDEALLLDVQSNPPSSLPSPGNNNYNEEEAESLSEGSSEDEPLQLGFHLDHIASIPGHWENEEIEIVFFYEDEQSEESSSESEDEHEIVFFECREDEADSQSSSETSTRYSDCRSQGTPLASEWSLPDNEKWGTPDDISTSSSHHHQCSPNTTKTTTPAYEWFHPDHLDVVLTKNLLFGPPQLQTEGFMISKPPASAACTTTVSTCFETASGSNENTHNTSESDDDSVDILSLGSGTSQVVQNLIEFVGRGI